MEILDGKKIALMLKEEIKTTVQKRRKDGRKVPHLAAVLVGDDPASNTYVDHKVKACSKVGFDSTLIKMNAQISEATLLAEIESLNNNKDIDGFIVQLPLPGHIDEQRILMAISPDKDVDGFHPANVGRMSLDLPCFVSATPAGIIEILTRYNIETEGKNVVVIGRSNIVGRPISILLSQKRKYGNATVTLTHSHTKNLEEFTKKADIIVAALGVPKFLKASMVKDDVIIVDVGIHRIPDESRERGYYLVGDVDFEEVSKKASYITPVPGGVGPMTIAMLLKNTLLACEIKNR